MNFIPVCTIIEQIFDSPIGKTMLEDNGWQTNGFHYFSYKSRSNIDLGLLHFPSLPLFNLLVDEQCLQWGALRSPRRKVSAENTFTLQELLLKRQFCGRYQDQQVARIVRVRVEGSGSGYEPCRWLTSCDRSECWCSCVVQWRFVAVGLGRWSTFFFPTKRSQGDTNTPRAHSHVSSNNLEIPFPPPKRPAQEEENVNDWANFSHKPTNPIEEVGFIPTCHLPHLAPSLLKVPFSPHHRVQLRHRTSWAQ